MAESIEYEWEAASQALPHRNRVHALCDYCKAHQHLRWMPWHDASTTCRSDQLEHCTCQQCRNVEENAA